MGEPQDPHQEAFRRLDDRLGALEASRTRKTVRFESQGSGAGYRLIAELVGGVLMGVGLGWLLDRFAHTSPWGMIGGVLIGAAGSIFLAVRSMSAPGGSE
jgi:ATP synthase protein I